MYRKDKAELLERLAIGCLSNDREMLSANLMLSPLVKSESVTLHIEENPETAAKAYNRIMNKTKASIMILAHHDVFLPEGWEQVLFRRIAEVEAIDPNWGILTAYGVDKEGTGWGPVWSTSIGQVIGRVALEPVPIQSADELLIVVRQRDGLVFDEGLPHFHFYGLDIVQTALAKGYGAWSVALPLVHNDGFKGSLDANYDSCYHYVRKKWRPVLPLMSSTAKVSWHGLHLHAVKRRMRESFGAREAISIDARADPRLHAERCGWETLIPSSEKTA